MIKTIVYDWGGANVWLFHAINNVHGDLLDRFMLLGTTLGNHANFPLYLALTALAGWLGCARKQEPTEALRWLSVLTVFSVAYVLDGWLVGWLKPLLDFPRPLLALPLHSVQVVGMPQYHHSLPSGHSSFAMLVIASLWPLLQGWRRLLGAACVLWVGISRVSVGAHFPADVVAGFLLSLLLVVLVRWLVTSYLRIWPARQESNL
ncbi:MAG: phosphatase PAP2 family protein [Burkholderiales bacterium]